VLSLYHGLSQFIPAFNFTVCEIQYCWVALYKLTFLSHYCRNKMNWNRKLWFMHQWKNCHSGWNGLVNIWLLAERSVISQLFDYFLNDSFSLLFLPVLKCSRNSGLQSYVLVNLWFPLNLYTDRTIWRKLCVINEVSWLFNTLLCIWEVLTLTLGLMASYPD
jgi:hypothetical protein